MAKKKQEASVEKLTEAEQQRRRDELVKHWRGWEAERDARWERERVERETRRERDGRD